MKDHTQHDRRARLALVLVLGLGLAMPRLASAVADADTQKCAKKLATGAGSYTEDFFEAASGCPLDNFGDSSPTDCTADEQTAKRIADARDNLSRELGKCTADSIKALCPFRAKAAEAATKAMIDGAGSFGETLDEINADLFTTSFAPACPRPATQVSRKAEDCASRLAQATSEAALSLEQCYSSCEISRLKKGTGAACVDATSGAAADAKALDCIDLALEELGDQVETRCDAATLTELGCPLGESTVPDLTESLGQALSIVSQTLNLGMFHSSCRGAGSTPGEMVPANVRLYPSGVVKQVACGASLDGAFFGANARANFESDLICSGAPKGTNGVVVAVSNVELTGNSKTAKIIGPNAKKNRTGAGILIGAGVSGVSIRGFKSVENWAVGIGDAGGAHDISIQSLTVRRNIEAGIRLAATKSSMQDVLADRNAIGFDLSGDGTTLRLCRAQRAAGAPATGVRVSGSDVTGDGQTVRVAENTIKDNAIGIRVEGSGHRVEQNEVRGSLGNGIEVASVGARVEGNSVKQGLTNGIVVSGSANVLLTNRADQNGGSGIIVTGDDNQLSQNGAGTLTDNGNGLFGFQIVGARTMLDTNKAEANLGTGFSVQAATALFKGNRSTGNHGLGFEFTTGGSSLEANSAQTNGGFEFGIGAGNLNLGGNRANGKLFSFGTAAANVE